MGIILTGVFAVTSVQRFWVHPSGGHTHRQSDTIGMSVAFAEQVRERGLKAIDFLIYPRILQHGFRDGINASEFPLLNVIGGIGFLIGSNPWVGVFLSSLLILLINIYVAYTHLPKLLRAWNIEVSGAACLLLWFAGGTLASQANIVMPEGIAFPLVIAGVVHFLQARNRLPLAWGVLLCSLGIAAKPTVVIVLGAVLVLPKLTRKYRTQWKTLLLGCVLSIIFPTWWYTSHTKHILSFAEGPQIFALASFNPIGNLNEVGMNGLISLLRREPHQGQLPMFVGWFFMITALALGEWIPVVLYLLSLVFAVSLDGTHIYVHDYYFIGTCVFAMILMARVLGAVQKHHYLKILTVIFLTWGVLFNIRSNVWIWARDSQYWKVNFWDMGAESRKVINKNYHIITDDTAYPQKLLFIGRSGTAASGSVYQVCNQSPYSKYSLAIVSDSSPPQNINLCGGRPLEFKTVETSFAKWYITLIPAL